MTHLSVDIQIAPEAVPSLPCWFAEVAIVAQCFTASGLLQAIEQRVRFARPRFGTYEVIDFVAVLIGYAVSAEPTLLAFYERLAPFASTFMALFNRQNLPHRSTERPLSCRLGASTCGGIACAGSRGSRGPERSELSTGRTVGSFGVSLARGRCGWHQTSRPTASASLPS